MDDPRSPVQDGLSDPEILKNLRFNTAFNLLDGAFFGLALGFASFITIIPLFVSTLTGSAILIGMIPAIHNMGWQLPQLLVANRVSRQSRFKPMVLRLTIHERLPYAGLALVAWLSPTLGAQVTLVMVFFLLIWQGFGGGFTAAPWQSMIAHIFPADRRGTFYGAQSAAANLLASLSAVLAGIILGRLVSPLDFTLCFLLALIAMTISWFTLALTREPKRTHQPAPVDSNTFWKNIAVILRRDENFRWFLVVRMVSQIAVMGFSFYTVYAVNTLGMSEETVGIMTGVMMGISIIANPLMGWLGDRWSYRSIMALGMLAASGSGLIAWSAPAPEWFYLAFALAAVAFVAVWTIPLAMTPEFGTEADRPAYIGMANTFIAPVTVLAPLFGGWLAQVAGYQATFMLSAAGGLVTAVLLQVMLRHPSRPVKIPLNPRRPIDMTEFFAYDDLTWPEVAALPRDLPLLLPLGSGYPLDRLASTLSNPDRVGLLPEFPFGWLGSPLVVPESVLTTLLSNLLDSLRDGGFTRVYALAPQDLKLGMGSSLISLPTQVRSSLGAAFRGGDSLADRSSRVVFIPIGHTEQHGYHLPLSTDTLIIDAIARGVVESAPDRAVRLPVMPYGVSTHRPSFAGTLNCGGRAFEDFWLAVIDTLVAAGYRLFYLNSGHGGNTSFLVNVIKYAGECYRRIFCATAWLHTSGPVGVAALEAHRRSPIGGMGHACELETSMILTLRPDLVHMERVVDEMDFISTPSYYMDWVEGGALVANPPWDDDTATGAYGAGSLATTEHGEIWLQAAIAEKVAHVAEIQEQHARREQRRLSGFGLWGNRK